jgi:hypothetical protein
MADIVDKLMENCRKQLVLGFVQLAPEELERHLRMDEIMLIRLTPDHSTRSGVGWKRCQSGGHSLSAVPFYRSCTTSPRGRFQFSGAPGRSAWARTGGPS